MRLYSPVRSVTDQLDGLEVGFSWWLHGSDLRLRGQHDSGLTPGQGFESSEAQRLADVLFTGLFLVLWP